VQNVVGLSQWDTPTDPLSQNIDCCANGTYGYTTTFTVAGATPTGVGYLDGQFASDNEVASIVLNGVTIYTGPTDGSSQFTGWTNFSDLGNFISGTNTLVFNVVNYAQNGGNPSGLDVQFTAASAAPEPATWAMMLLGFAGLGFSGYRRARKSRVDFSVA
jgi:hypothetical protein